MTKIKAISLKPKHAAAVKYTAYKMGVSYSDVLRMIWRGYVDKLEIPDYLNEEYNYGRIILTFRDAENEIDTRELKAKVIEAYKKGGGE